MRWSEPRSPRRGRCRGRLHVACEDAAAGTGAAECGEIHAFGGGHLFRERRRLYPDAGSGGRCAGTGGRGGVRGHGRSRGGSAACGRGSSGGCSGGRRFRGDLGKGAIGGRLLILSEQCGDGRAARDLLSGGDEQLVDGAVVEGLDLHRCLVGFHFAEDVPGGHLVAFLDAPFEECALRHRVGELRHFDIFGHGESWLGASTPAGGKAGGI